MAQICPWSSTSATRLEFADAAFDGCRTERVLQHVADPRTAVLEMIRVAKPGGWIVCCEPDWGRW
jgi:ubiquinone/menaquinone biosynthesis C-methylase UbiE